jgi:hypothetical protein
LRGIDPRSRTFIVDTLLVAGSFVCRSLFSRLRLFSLSRLRLFSFALLLRRRIALKAAGGGNCRCRRQGYDRPEDPIMLHRIALVRHVPLSRITALCRGISAGTPDGSQSHS